MEHEAKAQAQTSSATSTSTPTSHPLQDVPLNAADDVQPTPKNWVKFDDDTDISEKNNNSNGGDGSGSGSGDGDSNATQQQQQQQQNKLSLPPPPPSVVSSNNNRRARSRSPNDQSTAAAAAAPIPVQRTAVSSTTAGTLSSSSTSSLPDVTPAVLTTESTHVNLNASGSGSGSSSSNSPPRHSQQLINQKASAASSTSTATTSALASVSSSQAAPSLSSSTHPNSGASNNGSANAHGKSVSIPVDQASGMRTIELSTGRIREGFANGDVIVTLLPANTKWPWITPAIFRPELVPEELMAQGLTLTVEDYVNAMETLVNDYRFTVYNICYKRILVCWILFAFAVLLALLFSGLQGVALFALGVGWLFLNAAAIFLCMWMKLRLSRGLEKCLARVNKQLMRHKILLVLDDRGRISCHKVNLCFMYFDATQCVSFLNEFLEHTEQNGGEAIKAGWEAKLDIDVNDIVIQGSQPVRLSRKQAVAQELFLSYLQRWGKDFLRRRLDWTVQEAGVHETPRHLQSSICPCQYEEELLRNKIKISLQHRQCCGINCMGCWL
ncbi:rhoGEF domain-containing protein gxcI isoform X1 [Drosophila albomicans]|uniref:RhoGEF domain-containing protein gxcI isoform X1 n=1 Tax=Drosophila albomicans TaxID=7291 RepID=A0A9C6T1K5_DROAB|nr:rhoGEF domain-containing protein gxcI isoform X1 [Drosophila albomicans]